MRLINARSYAKYRSAVFYNKYSARKVSGSKWSKEVSNKTVYIKDEEDLKIITVELSKGTITFMRELSK